MTKNTYDEVLAEHDIQALAESLAPVSLSNQVKQRIRQSIDERLSGECPTGGKTVFASIGEWFALNDHISIKILHQDHTSRRQTALWRLKPGAVITSHRHDNEEECLVMEGSIRVGTHELNAGDFHQMEQGSYHPEITTETGALLYLKHDMHEHLMGPSAS